GLGCFGEETAVAEPRRDTLADRRQRIPTRRLGRRTHLDPAWRPWRREHRRDRGLLLLRDPLGAHRSLLVRYDAQLHDPRAFRLRHRSGCRRGRTTTDHLETKEYER